VRRRFDQAPTQGKISVSLWQGPDRMQMIRQDRGRFNRNGMSRLHPAKRGPEKADLLGQQPEPPVGQIDRKEVAPAGEEVSPIVGNRPILAGRKMGWVSLRDWASIGVREYELDRCHASFEASLREAPQDDDFL
jgi:hypothetical protein